MRLVLYFILGLSGAAGLIYESIWAHYLSLFVGPYAHVLEVRVPLFSPLPPARHAHET